MATLSFQKMFADRVQSGEKLHSVRPKRKRPQDWLPGKTVHLFTGMRTKYCRRLGLGVLTGLVDIEVHEDALVLDGQRITEPSWKDAFAVSDGFTCYAELVDFLQDFYGLPFTGDLIKWRKVA